MEPVTACELVNDHLVFAPHWEFDATDATHLHGGTIHVHVAYPAVETAREDAPKGYPNPVTGHAGFFVVVDDIPTRVELAMKLLRDVILPIYTHEARELLRWDPDYEAPLHPHTTEGQERWDDGRGDLIFGYPVFCPMGPAREAVES